MITPLDEMIMFVEAEVNKRNPTGNELYIWHMPLIIQRAIQAWLDKEGIELKRK